MAGDPTKLFSDRADDYARFRPSYPAAAVDWVLHGLQPPPNLDVADIGAGTGISARLLADRGCRVVAVEPNAAMRSAAEAHARVIWRDGTAEATSLPNGSVDLAVVAQAFHWFVVETAVREFRRILRPRGRLAIVWNRRDRDDAFALGYRDALAAIDAEAPAERMSCDPEVVTRIGCFQSHRLRSFANLQPMTEEQLIGRAMSTSSVPRAGERLQRLLAMLADLHARHRGPDGLATMVYRTDVHSWDVVA